MIKDNNSFKKKYKNKIKELILHNNLYFEKNKPKISDEDYDKLKNEILDLENKYPFLSDKNSPSKIVGFRPSKNFQKSNHREKMLSLSNIFDEKDLINFEKKIINFLDLKKNTQIEYSVEPKIDGISASLSYKKGFLISGLSRGDGEQGELITENLKTIKDIPQKISSKNFPEDIDIRGEVFITNKDFDKIKENFANARNAASGSLRQKNPLETKKIPLKFIAYSFGFFKNNQFKKQSDFIAALKKWGFKTNKFNKIISGNKNLIENHKQFENIRFQIDYDIDGLVYKVNSFELQNRLGFVSNAPRWATAHKFSAKSSYSQILNIDIQVGRTGALTPVAKIKPVNIGGVVVSNATLHNEDEINRKDIRIGDTVKIERAGDVIPHVVSVDLKKRTGNIKKYVFPNNCPSCGSSVIKEYNPITKKYDAVRRCSSEAYNCEKMSIEKIKHFISKDALNIDGLGKKVVEKFWDLNFIRYPQDIFKLNYKKIESLEGWGELSVSNLKYSIEKSKKVSLERLIFSLGIRHIGQENAKLIAYNLKNIENLKKINSKFNYENFLNIDGIGEIQINSLKNFFSNDINLNVIKELSIYLEIKNFEKKFDGKFKSKSFLITGKLLGISRAEAKSLIESNSGKIQSSVNNKLDYLITGEKPTAKKVNMAKQLKIKILSENDWKKMLD
tara:strand:+ start:1693 stop:3717 length:2025 start_codon:yes stop_codon:yes gene_type:complete